VCDCNLNSGLPLAKQALYYLSHTSLPFWSGYLGDRILWASRSQPPK
jgi:hypothetical protein